MTTDTVTDSITDTTAIVDAYIDMWNEHDEARRLALIDRAWTPDGAYVDPLLEAAGRDGLSAMVATVHDHYPGHVFRRTTDVDVHHASARFGWELVAPDGNVFVGGVDVARLADDGRLETITGFFGEMTPRT